MSQADKVRLRPKMLKQRMGRGMNFMARVSRLKRWKKAWARAEFQS